MKRKLDKEKVIARALTLHRMPETVLDTEQVCPMPSCHPLLKKPEGNVLPSQKKDDDNTSRLAVPDVAASEVQQACHMQSSHRLLRHPEADGANSDSPVSDVQPVCSTRQSHPLWRKPEAHITPLQEKSVCRASDVAVSDAAVHEAAIPDAAMSDAVASDAKQVSSMRSCHRLLKIPEADVHLGLAEGQR